MNKNRRAKFKAWLIKQQVNGVPNNQTIRTYVGNIALFEKRLRVDFDLAGSIGRQEIFASFEHTTESKENRHPNQNYMGFAVNPPEATLRGYRNSIQYYRKFCGDPVVVD